MQLPQVLATCPRYLIVGLELGDMTKQASIPRNKTLPSRQGCSTPPMQGPIRLLPSSKLGRIASHLPKTDKTTLAQSPNTRSLKRVNLCQPPDPLEVSRLFSFRPSRLFPCRRVFALAVALNNQPCLPCRTGHAVFVSPTLHTIGARFPHRSCPTYPDLSSREGFGGFSEHVFDLALALLPFNLTRSKFHLGSCQERSPSLARSFVYSPFLHTTWPGGPR